MNTILIIAVIAVIAVIAALIYFVLRKNSGANFNSLPIDPRRLRYEAATPLGIRVASPAPVARDQLEWIDAGYSRIKNIVTAAPYNYTNKMLLTDFQVWVVPGVSDAQGNPVFIRPAGQYTGTEWDIGGGFILAAGEFVPDFTPNPIVIAASRAREFTINAVSYEFEHFFLWNNDRPRYEATKTHLGSGHPIFAENI